MRTLSKTSESPPNLHARDFYTWAMETARALRERRFEHVDWESVAEELEDMGRSERKALRSQIARLLAHLLKWRAQADRRVQYGSSWSASIRNARRAIGEILEDNPGLKPILPDAFRRAWPTARDWAIEETNLPDARFPDACPWSLEQVLEDDFLPDDDPPLAP